jgi:hypothetical protein
VIRRGDTEYDEVKQMRNLIRAIVPFLLVAVCTPSVAEAVAEQEEQIVNRALRNSPDSTVPIIDLDRPVAARGDFDNDGLSDVALLTMRSTGDSVRSAAELRALERLHAENIDVPSFVVEITLGGSPATTVIDIGSYRVFETLETLPVDTANSQIGIRVVCRDPDGVHREIIIVDRDAGVLRLSINDTNTESSVLLDIDSDGDLDAVIMRRLPEAGIGYETFVEWYDLGALEEGRAGSFALVRELNSFLGGLAIALERRNWQPVVSHISGADNTVSTLPHVFVEHDEEGGNRSLTFDLHLTEDVISDVLVTQFVESPFPYPAIGEASQARIRVEWDDGTTRHFTATVQLLSNPFEDRLFAFLTEEAGGQ